MASRNSFIFRTQTVKMMFYTKWDSMSVADAYNTESSPPPDNFFFPEHLFFQSTFFLSPRKKPTIYYSLDFSKRFTPVKYLLLIHESNQLNRYKY